MALNSFYIVVLTLSVQRSLADKTSCDCECQDGLEICEDLQRLHTEVDVNTGDRKKWNRHFPFVQNFHERWEQEIVRIFNEEIENMQEKYLEPPQPFPSSNHGAINISRTISAVERQNQELQGQISRVEAKLNAAEDRGRRLQLVVMREREARKTSESFTKAIDRENLKLQSNISDIETKLLVVMDRATKIESNLQREKMDKIRSEMKNKEDHFWFERKNYELGDEISGVLANLSSIENRVETFHHLLSMEREDRKVLEDDSKRQQLIAENGRKELKDQISGIVNILSNLDKKSLTIQQDLHKEREAKNECKSDVEEIRSLIRVYNLEKNSRKVTTLENQVNIFKKRLNAVENEAMLLRRDIIKEKNIREEMQAKILEVQSTVLKVVDALGPALPPSVRSDLMKKLGETLAVSVDEDENLESSSGVLNTYLVN